ncbi:nucleoside triphosphate pyrophosphohydrolase [Bacillus litorisediminis]|uniref:nucleoside triphosphate pyrophosphohydrolase n=1 Tax=Bacillus litorisediminis TaxID=2922713 RepID=UPI0028BD64C3|nr:nucleoside triphosphate pyrophosphohydrolase [Bacillus litorisediminis]
MPTNNKLVRDNIPEIFNNLGKNFRTRILEDTEYLLELKSKFQEELNEYLQCKTNEEAIEELSDLLELVHTLGTLHGVSFEQ